MPGPIRPPRAHSKVSGLHNLLPQSPVAQVGKLRLEEGMSRCQRGVLRTDSPPADAKIRPSGEGSYREDDPQYAPRQVMPWWEAPPQEKGRGGKSHLPHRVSRAEIGLKTLPGVTNRIVAATRGDPGSRSSPEVPPSLTHPALLGTDQITHRARSCRSLRQWGRTQARTTEPLPPPGRLRGVRRGQHRRGPAHKSRARALAAGPLFFAPLLNPCCWYGPGEPHP